MFYSFCKILRHIFSQSPTNPPSSSRAWVIPKNEALRWVRGIPLRCSRPAGVMPVHACRPSVWIFFPAKRCSVLSSTVVMPPTSRAVSGMSTAIAVTEMLSRRVRDILRLEIGIPFKATMPRKVSPGTGLRSATPGAAPRPAP